LFAFLEKKNPTFFCKIFDFWTTTHRLLSAEVHSKNKKAMKELLGGDGRDSWLAGSPAFRVDLAEPSPYSFKKWTRR